MAPPVSWMRTFLAAVALLGDITRTAADTIKTKDGEEITCRVVAFEANHRSLASSRFLVEVDGEERSISLHSVESIEFERPGSAEGAPTGKLGVAALPSSPPPPTSPEAKSSESTSRSYWLTSSSRKRHNSKCRYYGSGKGRSCGPTEGVACKTCGG